jgi:predicted RNase H-like nuclease (RuvC/YqgF family)
MDSTVDEPSDDEVAKIYPPSLAGQRVPARILKIVEGRQTSRKKHDIVILKQKLGGSMRALQETQDLVVKLRNENAELRGIINDLHIEIGHLREQLHETRITVQRLSMEVPTAIGPVKNAVLQDMINNSRQRDKAQRRWNPITRCLAYACSPHVRLLTDCSRGWPSSPRCLFFITSFRGLLLNKRNG